MNGRDLTNSSILRYALLALLLPAAGLRISAQEPTDVTEMVELARKYQNGIGCPRDIGVSQHAPHLSKFDDHPLAAR